MAAYSARSIFPEKSLVTEPAIGRRKRNKLLEVAKFELGYQIPIKSPLSDQIRLYVGSRQAKGSKIFGIKRQIDTQKYGVTSSKKVLRSNVVLGVERSQKQSVIQGFGGDETKFSFQLAF